MRVNYFDLGLYRGVEMGWMVNNIFPALGINDYRVYGFEACKKYADNLDKTYRDNDKVKILHNAVCDTEKKVKLYYSPNMLGHSIFSTKNNVSENKFEEVDGIVFSKWLSDNNIELDNSLNILKVNIEGAEWHLFRDLVDNGINKNIHIFCGSGHDVEKIGELRDHIDEYYELLANNNIHLHRFSEWKPHTNADIASLIRKEYRQREISYKKGVQTKRESNMKSIVDFGDIKDLDVPQRYKKIWNDVSRDVQTKKAKNHKLTEEQTLRCFEQLCKRPYYLASLAEYIGAENIVEVGTAQGLQAFSFAEKIREQNNGKVWTCDILDVRNKKYAEFYKNEIHFCLGTSKDLGSLLQESNIKVDLFYIDGAHGYGDVIKDVFNLRQAQSENAVWVFDDYDERFGCFKDILKLIENKQEKKIYRVGSTASGNPNHQVMVRANY